LLLPLHQAVLELVQVQAQHQPAAVVNLHLLRLRLSGEARRL
jgi:hypothetical protein